MKIRAIAIDDEPLALKVLERHSEKVDFLSLKASFNNPLEAISYLEKNDIDLIFLDIQMPELSGLKVAKLIREKHKVIFTTAYEEYALEGFELSAIDYLLKPISFDRFLASCMKVQDLLKLEAKTQSVPSQEITAESITDDFIFIHAEYKTIKLMFKDILYIEGWKDYVKFHMKEELHLSLMSIRSLQERLPPQQFMRIHKSFIINLNHVEMVDKSQVKIREELINIGGSYKEVFSEWLAKYKIN